MLNSEYFVVRRLIALLLTLTMLLGAVFAGGFNIRAQAKEEQWTAYAASAFAGGDGSKKDPYQIADASQLAYVAQSGENYEETHLILTADIDLSAHEWVPIKHFAGTLDGNGKTVSGLTMGTEGRAMERTGKDEWGAGLFNVLSGTVKNLSVSGAIYVKDSVQDQKYGVGLIAGRLEGTLDRCTTKGTVDSLRAHNYVAGMVGVMASGSSITNCSNEANVTGSATLFVNNMGGLVGLALIDMQQEQDILIANCRNSGEVLATGGTGSLVSGVAGSVESISSAGATIRIYNCYNAVEMPETFYGTSVTKGNIAAKVKTENGGNVESKYLYHYMGIYNEALPGIRTEEMNMADVAVQLTECADILVGDGYCTNLLAWSSQNGEHPILETQAVTGSQANLTVSVNSDRMGTVSVMADIAGTGGFAPVTTPTVAKGSHIRVTLEAASSCAIVSVRINGEEQIDTLSDNALTFTLNKATKVEVVFEVETTVDVEPIYVRADAAAGGDGSEAMPFATLQEAQNKLRQVLEAQPNANITIYLMDGIYRLTETLKLTQEDSSLGCVTIKNYQDAKPVLTSGQPTGVFTQVEGKEYYCFQLPESVKVNGAYPMSRDLYVNTERATLARTDFLRLSSGFINPVMDKDKPNYIDYADNGMYVNQAALADIPDDEIAGVELSFLNEWKNQMFHLESRDSTKVRNGEVYVTLNQKELDALFEYDRTLKSPSGATAWLQNHLAFLDEPGEFYYDQKRGIIYYYPYADEDMTTAVVEYGTLDKLIEMDHASNFTVDGIQFAGTTANWITENGVPGQLSGTLYGTVSAWGDCGGPMPCGAIYGDYAEGISIQNCIFEDLGGSAIVFQFGTKNLKIIGNRMKDLALAGVHIGVGQLKWNQDGIPGQAENVTISNNYVTNVGTLIYNVVGISVKRCENLTITHNKIVHVPYAGISAGWGFDISTNPDSNKNLVNAEIAYNYIEDFIHRNNDGGAIYVCGANASVIETERFNTIHDNYIRAGAHNRTYTGIYHDGSSSNYLTYHNFIDDVVSDFGAMMFQDNVRNQYSHNITARDNFSTSSPVGQSGNLDKNNDPRNIVLENNIRFENRGEASEEALEIMRNAGLEAEYAHLEKPMETELRIADDTMHYTIYIKSDKTVVTKIEITNHYAVEKVYTLTAEGLPKGVELVFNGGQSVTVEAGKTVVVEGVFAITDKSLLENNGDQVITLTVTDQAGRQADYPRFLTVKTTPRKPPEDTPATAPGGEAPVVDEPVMNLTGYVVGGMALLAFAVAMVLVIRRKQSES